MDWAQLFSSCSRTGLESCDSSKTHNDSPAGLSAVPSDIYLSPWLSRRSTNPSGRNIPSFPIFSDHVAFLPIARRADQRLGDQQHRLHQHVCPGDAPETPGLWNLWLHQEPLQHLRRDHRGHQVTVGPFPTVAFPLRAQTGWGVGWGSGVSVHVLIHGLVL